MPPAERRLLAVMFTDIKGYSAMVGADAPRTLRAVTEHRAIVRELLAAHGGHEHRTTGDGFLVLFESAVNAVTCAIAIQQRMLARNAERPPAEQLWLRIGLNLGEVVYDADGDVFGDAVNIAARVEPHAPPGGVAFTEAVAVAVRGHVSRPIEPMGRLDLKNIASPPELFRIAVAPFTAPKKRLPWAAIGVSVAAAAIVATAAVLSRPEPTRWPVVTQNAEAQRHFEAALDALEGADRSLAMREIGEALANDQDAPMFWVVGATQPIWLNAGDFGPAVALVEGRSDAEAELVRLCAWTAADGDEIAEGRAWDAWLPRNPFGEVGEFLRAAYYPRHADDNLHSPGEVHTNEVVLKRFVADHPSWAGARVLLAGELRHRAAEDEALALLTETAAGCHCPLVWQELGDCQLWVGRYEEAAISFQTAVERDPALFDARYKLADIALERGDEAKRVAIANAMMAETSRPMEKYTFAINHGSRLLSHGRRADALALLGQGGEAVGGLDLRLLRAMIQLEIALDEADAAEEHLSLFDVRTRDPELQPAVASAAAAEALMYRARPDRVAARRSCGDPAPLRQARGAARRPLRLRGPRRVAVQHPLARVRARTQARGGPAGHRDDVRLQPEGRRGPHAGLDRRR